MSKRTYNTEIREPWNEKIYNILKTIDLHSKLHLETGEDFHLLQATVLRNYLNDLKDWIVLKEKTFK
jgi:hypothetical protein